ncbi:MAG: hypothetical protein Q8Q59_00775 [Luteolibacter sp.]|nr:hypothetical protein [Luteolibacter sp.]
MTDSTRPTTPQEDTDHDLTDHDGILRVAADPAHAIVDVDFNPAVLSDGEVRSLLKEHNC